MPIAVSRTDAAFRTDAARLLLFADARRSVAGPDARVRRYRLARLRLDATGRDDGQPRYAYLKRGHD